MDDRPERRTRSLTFRLSASIAVTVLLVAAGASVLSFVFAFEEANELQDAQLIAIGTLLDEGNVPPPIAQPRIASSSNTRVRVVLQALDDASKASARDAGSATRAPALGIPPGLADGLHTVKFDNERWRLYVHTLQNGRRVAIAQNTALRDEIARDGSMRTLVPLLMLMPLLAVLILLVVRRLMRPVVVLAQLVDRQRDTPLTPLPNIIGLREIEPFVRSINRMIARVKRAVDEQNRFVANAAHELRSPITALSLQAENLEAADMPDDARARLQVLRTGLARARQLLEQLLTFARLQSDVRAKHEAVRVTESVTRALADCVVVAERKHIELGASRFEAFDAATDGDGLYLIVRNLIDNAVCCTPEGGIVDVRVFEAHGTMTIEVEDTGPGIAPDEIGHVFAPFYRVPGSQVGGSGLGLAIVAETARRLGGTISLENTRKGLVARYTQRCARGRAGAGAAAR
jgi:two-component system OmpR family sensor kinase